METLLIMNQQPSTWDGCAWLHAWLKPPLCPCMAPVSTRSCSWGVAAPDGPKIEPPPGKALNSHKAGRRDDAGKVSEFKQKSRSTSREPPAADLHIRLNSKRCKFELVQPLLSQSLPIVSFQYQTDLPTPREDQALSFQQLFV